MGGETSDLEGRHHALPIDPDAAGERRAGTPASSRPATRSIVSVVAASGALGAVARYELERALPSRAGQYPWGTFWVNVSGSLAIGFVLVLLSDRFPRARLARPLIATGFLGAYTTFSTYAVEAVDLSRGHHVATAVAYALSSLIAGGVAVVIGMALARLAGRADASVELGPTEPQALEEQSEA